MARRARANFCYSESMTLRDPGDLKSVMRPGQRLLGLDLGEKTIGLALSDRLLTVASPFETLKRANSPPMPPGWTL